MWGKRASRSGGGGTRDAAGAAVALLSVRVARDRGAVARFNDAVERELLPQVPHNAVRAMQIALDELLTNVIMHADQAAGPIEVEIARERDAVATTIRYIAAAFDPTTWTPVRHAASVTASPVGGRGIELVRALMDEFVYGYEDGYNVVSVRKRCSFV